MNSRLESLSDPSLFAVGDCADFVPRRLPRLGVFGVRAAPVLLHNLLSLATKRPRKAYRPQKIWLSILNLGNDQGLLRWGRFWWTGKLSLRLKDYLDRDFLRRYREEP